MRPETTPKARIVLLGLEDSLATELGEVLARQGQAVYRVPFYSGPDWLRAIHEVRADVVFCSSDRSRYLPLIEALHQVENNKLPIVVVSHSPEVSDWLDAMDAGASDYCAAPFEARQMRWILDSTLKDRNFTAVRRDIAATA